MAGRKALVSGGHSGKGLVIAKKMQKAGVLTAMADTCPASKPSTGIVVSYACDNTSALAGDQLYWEVNLASNKADILVCNAGQKIHEKLTEGDSRKWQKVFGLNFMGAFRPIGSFVPVMPAAGSGIRVFLSLVAVGQAYLYRGIYAGIKATLENIAETLRQVMRVITTASGVTDTFFLKTSYRVFAPPKLLGAVPCRPKPWLRQCIKLCLSPQT